MTDTRFIIVCREAFLEAGTNNLNLIGIFSRIRADKFPYVMRPFALVVNFDSAVDGNHTLRTRLAGPDGAQVTDTSVPVRTNQGNWQVIAHFDNLRLAAPGIYTFHIGLDGEPLGDRAVEVTPALARASRKAAVT